ncbi:inorganic triphosphatase [Paraglaciecola marina]|uniref:CYTH domain-containing protein n=1 Tax=Paraglaciecola marina TaxID=2500157 RepID=UPI00141520B4|nr:CYTH domain-containing protein [Paraglaciecola marina]
MKQRKASVDSIETAFKLVLIIDSVWSSGYGDSVYFIKEEYIVEFEIELKLLTNNDAGEVIDKKLLPSLKGNVKKEVVTLTNYYFDTQDRLLRKHDIGLRIRSNNQYCEQTLKTSGQSIGGLHKRPEYNVSLDSYDKKNIEFPNLSLFESSAWPNNFDLEAVQNNLETMFSTNFTRHVYQLDNDTSSIELVWDYGEVRSGELTLPICEIELELKKGGVKDLFNLAKQISSLMPLGIGVHSKAARGYKLADDAKISSTALPKISNDSLLSAEQCVELINKALSHFQLYSTFFSFNHQSTHSHGVSDISKALNLLTFSLQKLFNLTSCNELSELCDKAVNLKFHWSSTIQDIETDKVNNWENLEQLSVFLTNSQTIDFQLDLVQVMLEKPWVIHS